MKYFVCAMVVLMSTVHAADHPFFQKQILLGAHRGGNQMVPENTLHGFQKAAIMLPDILLEGESLEMFEDLEFYSWIDDAGLDASGNVG